MPLPSLSPVHAPKPSHYASPAEFETNPLEAGSSRKERRHRKKPIQYSSGRRSEAPFTWKEQLLQLVAIFLTAGVVYKLALGAVGWVEEVRRPFCDGLQEPVRDSCRPCPDNGICGDGELRCSPGFRRQGALCVPDRQIDRIAHYLAESVQSEVCRISGDSLCKEDETTWVPEHELWDAIMEEKMGLNAQSSWLVREKAIQIVRDKLNIRIDDFGLREFECPIGLAVTYQVIGCRIRKGIKANFHVILLTISIVVSVAVCILRNLEYRKVVNRAEEIYLQVCEVLKERADGASGETKWVVASRLRDHLLLPSERKITALWKEIEALVREDFRIDQYSMLVNGDSRVVWEWQGNMRVIRREAGVSHQFDIRKNGCRYSTVSKRWNRLISEPKFGSLCLQEAEVSGRRYIYLGFEQLHSEGPDGSEGADGFEDADDRVGMHICESTTDIWRSSTNRSLPSELGVDVFGSSIVFRGLYVMFSSYDLAQYWLHTYNTEEDVWKDTNMYFKLGSLSGLPQLIVSDNRLFLVFRVAPDVQNQSHCSCLLILRKKSWSGTSWPSRSCFNDRRGSEGDFPFALKEGEPEAMESIGTWMSLYPSVWV